MVRPIATCAKRMMSLLITYWMNAGLLTPYGRKGRQYLEKITDTGDDQISQLLTGP